MQAHNNVENSVSLDEIVNNYLDQYKRPDKDYRIIYGIAVRGLRIFYRDATGYPQTVQLTVLANNTAVLPVGAMNRIDCGVLNNRGEFASLNFDPLLSILGDNSTSRLSQTTNDLIINNEQYFIGSLENNNGFLSGYPEQQLGVGGQPVLGFYNIDWQNRIMIFNFGTFNYSTVLFKYLGIPSTNDGDYFVHPFFQEALISWIDWQVSKPKRLARRGKSAEEVDFDIQYRNAMKALEPFNLSDLYNQWRSSQRMAVKS